MFKKEKFKILQILSSLIGVSAFIASLTGIVYPDIYKPIVLDRTLSFVLIQDFISLVAAILLLIITFFGKNNNIKLNIIQTAIIGYMFYAYGMYTLGTLYNYLYFFYLSILSLSIFYFINTFTGIQYNNLKFSIPEYFRLIIAIFCAVTPVIFVPQWIILILKYVHDGLRPSGGNFSFFVSLPILDLCFVIPVFVMCAIYLFQKKILGVFLAGILLVKLFTLFVAVSLGYLLQPIFQNAKMDIFNAILYSVIGLVCLILSIIYFIQTKIIRTDINGKTNS